MRVNIEEERQKQSQIIFYDVCNVLRTMSSRFDFYIYTVCCIGYIELSN